MKRILFVIDSITCGGAEKGLISLLNNIEYSNYDVDLLYFCHENEYYLNEIPNQVHIIEPDLVTQLALSSGGYVLSHVWNFHYLSLIIKRILFGIMGKIDRDSYFRRRAKDWKILRRYIPELEKKYDAAIAYLENYPVYFTLDKVKAKKYIVWQRTDYKKTGCKVEWDLPYFQRADTICVLSEEMKNNFLSEFPGMKEKVVIFPNIVDIKNILEKSKENISFDDAYSGFRIVSVGTLRHVKGYDVSMRACKRLLEKGYDFRWYIIGSGEELKQMQKEIMHLGIEERFILLGNKRNPYAFVAQSDIFVQCSYREGFSTTVFEAKCLQKPIVITDAPGMKNQIEHGVNGIIVPTGNSDEVANAVEKLMNSSDLRMKFSGNLKCHLENSNVEVKRRLELFEKITG
ncbi:MAG: glycosyltransferase [Dorea sp.]|nr:glycosyltransferase [Dorea sp.]